MEDLGCFEQTAQLIVAVPNSQHLQAFASSNTFKYSLGVRSELSKAAP